MTNSYEAYDEWRCGAINESMKKANEYHTVGEEWLKDYIWDLMYDLIGNELETVLIERIEAFGDLNEVKLMVLEIRTVDRSYRMAVPFQDMKLWTVCPTPFEEPTPSHDLEIDALLPAQSTPDQKSKTPKRKPKAASKRSS